MKKIKGTMRMFIVGVLIICTIVTLLLGIGADYVDNRADNAEAFLPYHLKIALHDTVIVSEVDGVKYVAYTLVPRMENGELMGEYLKFVDPKDYHAIPITEQFDSFPSQGDPDREYYFKALGDKIFTLEVQLLTESSSSKTK